MADTFRVTQIVFKKCVVRYQTYYIRMLARVELQEYVCKKKKKHYKIIRLYLIQLSSMRMSVGGCCRPKVIQSIGEN